jgi:hypothetical protein
MNGTDWMNGTEKNRVPERAPLDRAPPGVLTWC